MPVKKRHQSRELALQILYADEFRARNEESRDNARLVECDDEEVKTYAFFLSEGYFENREKIDGVISRYSEKRKINEISIVDLCILRLSIFMLMFDKSVHPNIVVDEAVKLSKDFSTEINFRFINGLLDSYIKSEVGK